MKISKTILAVIGTAVIACGLMSPSANAVPITGSVAFLGSVTASGPSGPGSTTITFSNPWTVVGASGSYPNTGPNNVIGKSANFTSFSFTGNDVAAVLSGGPVIPLWAFPVPPSPAGPPFYSFDLTALTSATVLNGGIAITGIGKAHITGFDDTNATWALSGTSATGFTFSFATSTTTAAVPEGGSALALLGISLIAVEAIRRKIVAA